MFRRTRDYAKDYERVGKTVRYTGRHYRFEMEPRALRGRKAAYLLFLFAALGLYAAIGLSDAESFGGAGVQAAFYVVLPYVGLVLPLGLALARAVLLVIKRKPLEYAEYDKYLVRQKGLLIASLALDGCLTIGLLAYLLFADGRGLLNLAVFAGALLCGACIFAAFSQYHALFSRVSIDETNGVRYDS